MYENLCCGAPNCTGVSSLWDWRGTTPLHRVNRRILYFSIFKVNAKAPVNSLKPPHKPVKLCGLMLNLNDNLDYLPCSNESDELF